MEERGEEFGVVVDVLRGIADFDVEFGIVFRNEVDEKDILHVLPTLLDGVQFRRVRRKVFKDEPTRMFSLKEILCGDVSRESIPNNHCLFVQMQMQLNQPKDKILGYTRTVHDREMKFHFATGRRCADETEAGLILSRERFIPERYPFVKRISRKFW